MNRRRNRTKRGGIGLGLSVAAVNGIGAVVSVLFPAAATVSVANTLGRAMFYNHESTVIQERARQSELAEMAARAELKAARQLEKDAEDDAKRAADALEAEQTRAAQLIAEKAEQERQAAEEAAEKAKLEAEVAERARIVAEEKAAEIQKQKEAADIAAKKAKEEEDARMQQFQMETEKMKEEDQEEAARVLAQRSQTLEQKTKEEYERLQKQAVVEHSISNDVETASQVVDKVIVDGAESPIDVGLARTFVAEATKALSKIKRSQVEDAGAMVALLSGLAFAVKKFKAFLEKRKARLQIQAKKKEIAERNAAILKESRAVAELNVLSEKLDEDIKFVHEEIVEGLEGFYTKSKRRTSYLTGTTNRFQKHREGLDVDSPLKSLEDYGS